MNTNPNYFKVLASVAVLGLAAFASPVKAQSATCEGSFTLPYEVTWQAAQIPAGEYTFTLKSKGFPARMMVHGPNGTIFVSAIGMTGARGVTSSELLVESRDGKRYVGELNVAGCDLHVRYFLPKVKNLSREVLLAQGPSTTDHVAVLRARK
jgi:hypothetical protein